MCSGSFKNVPKLYLMVAALTTQTFSASFKCEDVMEGYDVKWFHGFSFPFLSQRIIPEPINTISNASVMMVPITAPVAPNFGIR